MPLSQCFVAGVHSEECVAIGEFLSTTNAAQGRGDDVLLAFPTEDLREALGLT